MRKIRVQRDYATIYYAFTYFKILFGAINKCLPILAQSESPTESDNKGQPGLLQFRWFGKGNKTPKENVFTSDQGKIRLRGFILFLV